MFFNTSGTEFLIILLVALVVLGPEKLPDFIRKVGRVVSEVRRMANGFQAELRDTLGEPTKELRETIDLARTTFIGDGKPTSPTNLISKLLSEGPTTEPVAGAVADELPGEDVSDLDPTAAGGSGRGDDEGPGPEDSVSFT
ncbi:MAG TPA: Sec-independent protein translocase protein TatB [Acidimicrobiales bacterium]